METNLTVFLIAQGEKRGFRSGCSFPLPGLSISFYTENFNIDQVDVLVT
jgi:hypothetical protein